MLLSLKKAWSMIGKESKDKILWYSALSTWSFYLVLLDDKNKVEFGTIYNIFQIYFAKEAGLLATRGLHVAVFSVARERIQKTSSNLKFPPT